MEVLLDILCIVGGLLVLAWFTATFDQLPKCQRCPKCKTRRSFRKTGEIRNFDSWNEIWEEEYKCENCGHIDWEEHIPSLPP